MGFIILEEALQSRDSAQYFDTGVEYFVECVHIGRLSIDDDALFFDFEGAIVLPKGSINVVDVHLGQIEVRLAIFDHRFEVLDVLIGPSEQEVSVDVVAPPQKLSNPKSTTGPRLHFHKGVEFCEFLSQQRSTWACCLASNFQVGREAMYVFWPV